MKIRKISTIFLCLLMVAAVFAVGPMNIVAEEEPPVDPPEEPEIPEEPGLEGEGEWWIDDNGTYFELTNSSYLNITFTSSENIHLYLESIPKMIDYHIERNCTANSTDITISGFEASTTYYRYQEGDLQEEFTTDETGSYSYTQDISTHHHVFIQELKATIYIYSDGSVSDPTKISRNGEIYTQIDDIYESIYIQRSGITLDGAGYIVDGPGTGYGIYLSYINDATIKNLDIIDFVYGIYLYRSSSNTLTGNTISGSTSGICLQVYSSNNMLSGNTITGSSYAGIVLYYSNSNTVSGNTISGGTYGIYLGYSPNNTLSGNTISGSTYGIYLYYFSSSNTLTGNTISGSTRGIYLDRYSRYNTISGNTISGSTIPIYLYYGSSSNTLSGNIISGGTYGIYLGYSPSNTLSGNTISGSSRGIYLYRSNINTLTGNTISGGSYGIYLYRSGTNTITENSISVSYMGIYMDYSCYSNTVSDNEITGGSYGFYVYNNCYSNTLMRNSISVSYMGIYIYWSDSNKVRKNSISGSSYGIYMNSIDYSTINENIISYNTYGIRIYYSNSNTIYHNNIIDNNYQAYDSYPANNDWHHPELLRGNYWSDYTGTDVDGDGIGDTLIPHPWSNYDFYPLMTEFYNTAPTISSFTATTPALEGSPVTFTVIANDIEGDELTYSFDFDDDGTFDLTGSDDIVTHYYADDFQGTARVRVSDEDYSAEATTPIEITNVNPTVDAGTDLTTDEGYPFSPTITFSDPGFDYSPWGTVEDFTASIDWGDSLVEPVEVQETPGGPGVPTQGSLLLEPHTYVDNGEFTVKAEVWDDEGGCGSDSMTVTVDNVPPAVEIVRMRAQVEGDDVFPPSSDVLAQFEFNGDVTDSSGNGRDAVLLGGEFVPTEFGQGLYVYYETDPNTGEILPMGIDWSAFADLLNHPYTIEIVLTPDYIYEWAYQKLFGFDDDHDNGWYYYRYGFQAWPNPEFGSGQMPPLHRHYLAIVSTSPHTIDVYLQGDYLGSTDASFSAPPSQAIFFRDDTDTGRYEQLRATVEALRISGTTRSLSEIGAIQQRLGSIPPVVPLGTTVNFKGTFNDPGIQDAPFTAEWIFDSDSVTGTVDEVGGSGEVTGQYTFDTAGIYNVILRVTDKDRGVGEANTIQGITAIVVVYDPEDGFVTGGGWINSPPGAYIWDPLLEGKATFGFVSKYQTGASVPSGKTEFHFNAADLHFTSDSYEWLVIAGARAQYKGSGTLVIKSKWGGPWDKEYECKFMLTAIDGQRPGGGGKDKFRIKIWDKAYGTIIYDNQRGAGESEDPTTVIGGGNIQIHKG